MNHDIAHKSFRLRGFALQLERGNLDDEFAEAQAPIADIRAAAVQRIRQLADAIEGQGPGQFPASLDLAGGT